MGKDMRPFFVMPGSALKDLREELQLLNGNDAGRTMERYGFRAGVGLVRTLGLEDVLPPAPTTEERNSILDLFRR